jgi:hypothetical protein
MVMLTNIRIEGDWILAHALDRETNVETDIAVCISKNELKIANGDIMSVFAKACWELKYWYKSGKKLPKEYEINWGM